MSDNTAPQVIPFEIEPNPTAPGCLLVRVRCPACGGVHSHGIPAGDAPKPEWGNRVADCGGPSYDLINPRAPRQQTT